MNRFLDEWMAVRSEIAAMERAEHPDIIDRYGRIWTWSRGDIYHHDDTLGFPLDMIDSLNLPSARLADNPNYDGLCDICRSEWPNDNTHIGDQS